MSDLPMPVWLAGAAAVALAVCGALWWLARDVRQSPSTEWPRWSWRRRQTWRRQMADEAQDREGQE